MKNDRTRFVSSRQRAGRKKINEDHWRDYTRVNSYLYSRYFSRSSSREDWRHAVSVLPTETVKILSAARMATLLARLNESKHKIQWNWKIFLIRAHTRVRYVYTYRIHTMKLLKARSCFLLQVATSCWKNYENTSRKLLYLTVNLYTRYSLERRISDSVDNPTWSRVQIR